MGNLMGRSIPWVGQLTGSLLSPVYWSGWCRVLLLFEHHYNSISKFLFLMISQGDYERFQQFSLLRLHYLGWLNCPEHSFRDSPDNEIKFANSYELWIGRSCLLQHTNLKQLFISCC